MALEQLRVERVVVEGRLDRVLAVVEVAAHPEHGDVVAALRDHLLALDVGDARRRGRRRRCGCAPGRRNPRGRPCRCRRRWPPGPGSRRPVAPGARLHGHRFREEERHALQRHVLEGRAWARATVRARACPERPRAPGRPPGGRSWRRRRSPAVPRGVGMHVDPEATKTGAPSRRSTSPGRAMWPSWTTAPTPERTGPRPGRCRRGWLGERAGHVVAAACVQVPDHGHGILQEPPRPATCCPARGQGLDIPCRCITIYRDGSRKRYSPGGRYAGHHQTQQGPVSGPRARRTSGASQAWLWPLR